MVKKERQEPWNPSLRNCNGCHFRIIDREKTYEKFCNRISCKNYCDDNEYELWLEEYYSWEIDNDTSYERSDESLCGKKDRVWEKIRRIQETEYSYSGEYMYNYIWNELYEKNIISDDQVNDIKTAIRKQYSYNISKCEYSQLCKNNIDMGFNYTGFSPNGWRLDEELDNESI
jgi:hypothetical protein